MFEISVEQVRHTPVADLADAVLRLGDEEILGGDLASAEALVLASQRVLNAAHAVQVLAIEAWGRRESEGLAAGRAQAQALGRRYCGPVDEHELLPSQIAPLLHIAPRTCATRYATARTIAALLPLTLAAMRAGHLEPYKATAIAQEVPTSDPALCAALEERLFPAVLDLPTSRTRALTRRHVARIDPEAVRKRATRARAARSAWVSPGTDPGMTHWEADQPADTSVLAWAAVNALAHEYLADGDQRTMHQARADAMMDLVLGNATVTVTADISIPLTPTPPRPTAEPGATPGTWTEGAEPEASGAGATGTPAGPGVDPEDPGTAVAGPGVDPEDPGTAVAGPGVDPEDPGTAVAGSGVDPEDPGTGAGDTTAQPEASGEGATGTPAGPRGTGERDPGHASGWGAFHLGTIAVPALDPEQLSVPDQVLLPGIGTLAGDQIIAILGHPDTRLRRITTDPLTGWAIDVGARLYRPHQALGRTVRKRDKTCRFPGCATSAEHCDLDHVLPFPLGPTVKENLLSLCRRHHRLKHHAGWTLEMTALGVCTWTNPRGQQFITEPADYRELAA